MHIIAIISVLVTLMATSEHVIAEDRKSYDLVLRFADSTISETALEPSIANGIPAIKGDFPAALVFEGMRGRCSATLVSAQTFITANHCVYGAESVSIYDVGKYVSVECSSFRSFAWSSYRQRAQSDLAACHASHELRPEGDLEYEKLSVGSTGLSNSDYVLLTGYGCGKRSDSEGDDRTYRYGASEIASIRSDRLNLVLTTKGGAAACLGDSGGAVYEYIGDKTRAIQRNVKQPRRIVAVIARGGASQISKSSHFGTLAVKDFMESWSSTRDINICGLSDEAGGCRE